MTIATDSHRIDQHAKRFDIASGGSPVDQDRTIGGPMRTDAATAYSHPFSGGGQIEAKRIGSMDPSSSSYMMQLFHNRGGAEELSKPYLETPVVYACINAIARAVLRVGHTWRAGPNPDDAEIDSARRPAVAALDRLIRQPNPIISGRKHRRLEVIYSQLFGESFQFLLSRRGGRLAPVEPVDGSTGPMARIPMPDEVWIVRGDIVNMELDASTQLPGKWMFSTQKGRQEIPAHATYHPYEADPYNIYRGLGPMQAAFRTASKDFGAERYDDALIRSGGQPCGVYEADGFLSPEQKDEIRRKHRENFQRPENDRSAMVLSEGSKYRNVSMSPRDMEFQAMRANAMQIMMMIFGVTKPMLSITDDVNRANAEEASRVFWINTISPWLDFSENEMSTSFVQRILGLEDVWFRYDRSQIAELQEDVSGKIQDTTRLMSEGQRSFNEAARISRLDVGDAVDGGDERYIPGNMVPAGMVEEILRMPRAAQGGLPTAKRFDHSALILAASMETTAGVDPKSEEPEAPAEPEADLTIPSDDLTETQLAWTKGWDRERKDAYLARVERALSGPERTMQSRSGKVFRAWLNDVKARLRNYTTDKSIGTDPARAEEFREMQLKRTPAQLEAQLDRLLRTGIQRFEAEMARLLASPFDDAWDNAAKDLAREVGAEGFIGHETPGALRFLRDKRIKLAEGAMSTIAQDVKLAIFRVLIDEGPATGSLARRLEAVLRKADQEVNRLAGGIPSRAERIAQTEGTSIANRSRSDEMKRDGVEKHMWISAKDDNVRPHHSTDRRKGGLDGVVRQVGKEFGHRLRYPGDINAAASEVVWCRCTTAPVPNE